MIRRYAIPGAMVLLAASIFFEACKGKNEELPVLNLPDSLFIAEGTETVQFALINAQLTAPATENVSIEWSTLNGSARDSVDFKGQTGVPASIAKGKTGVMLEVELIPNSVYEDDKTFSVTINNLQNAFPGNLTCIVTILNDDPYIPELLPDPAFSQKEGNAGETLFKVPVRLSGPSASEVRFKWSTQPGWAKDNDDFLPVVDAQCVFMPGDTEEYLDVIIMGDEVFEMDEHFDIHLTEIQGATASKTSVRVFIEDDDTYSPEWLPDGYITPGTWPGMVLAWSDEFEGPSLNAENWTHELGGGGWGNNEWQIYTSLAANSFLSDGKLNIVATKVGDQYFSARIVTKAKKEFTYGRIDIRARMPYGKGIWPALWTLGANIGQVGWPRCGEIDIMEYIGHIQSQTHGTVHYYQSGHRSITSSFSLPGNQSFHNAFHVFTILWQENTIKWYVDYQLFHQVKDTQLPFESFRLPHFFIFNLAVGGNWPGYPDPTTVFPQTLEVDYIRVFQYD